jgi:hypothetical protein
MLRDNRPEPQNKQTIKILSGALLAFIEFLIPVEIIRSDDGRPYSYGYPVRRAQPHCSSPLPPPLLPFPFEK